MAIRGLVEHGIGCVGSGGSRFRCAGFMRVLIIIHNFPLCCSEPAGPPLQSQAWQCQLVEVPTEDPADFLLTPPSNSARDPCLFLQFNGPGKALIQERCNLIPGIPNGRRRFVRAPIIPSKVLSVSGVPSVPGVLIFKFM